MSLKAKIEAVIYASEEPVTLPQLVGLLGEEGQAELDALASRQTTLALDDPSDDAATPDDLNAEILGEEAAATSEPPQLPAPGSGLLENLSELDPLTSDVAQTPDPNPSQASPEPTNPAAQKARERALRDYFRDILTQLTADYTNGDRGLEIREVAGGFRLGTKPEYHDAVRGFVKSLKPPLKLSLQALETLAVVAYKQPVTAPEVSEIRGVDSGGVLGGLMTRKLVTTAGRKQVIGRPILYKTTKDFLVRFGLKDIAELPSIEEFEKMAGELVDADPVQEEIPMSTSAVAPPHLPGGYLSDAPEPPQQLNETCEDLMSDKSDGPYGHKAEPPIPLNVELSAHIHQPQADGDSEEPSADTEREAMDSHEPYEGSDETGA